MGVVVGYSQKRADTLIATTSVARFPIATSRMLWVSTLRIE